MPPTIADDLGMPSHHLGCNCQYPMILLGFIILTIVALLVCVCICCIDATKCSPFKTSRKSARLKCAPLRDATKFIERKLSMEPGVVEYTTLNNSLSWSSSESPSTRSATLRSEASLVSTV